MRPYNFPAKKNHVSNITFQTHDTYVPNGKSTFTLDHLEHISTQEGTKRTIKLLDTDYKKANLPEIDKDTCGLSSVEQWKLFRLFEKYEDFFDGTHEDFDTNPVKFDLQMGAKTYHGNSYLVLQSQKAVFNKKK